MQQKNYFYYIILLLIPPAVVLKSRFVTRDNLYMIVPLAIAYLCYFFCLMLVLQIIYSAVRNKKQKDFFVCIYTYDTKTCTFWLDGINGELAVLFISNPFKLQYIPVSDIDSVSVSVDYELGHKKDRAYASRINIVMQIKGKRYKIPIAIGASKYMIIRMAGNGKLILEEAEKFADILLNVKEEKRKARLLQETGKYD